MLKFGGKKPGSSVIEKKKEQQTPPHADLIAVDSKCIVMGDKVDTVSKPSYLVNQYPVNSHATLNRMYRIDGVNGGNQQLLQSPPKKPTRVDRDTSS